MFNHVIESRSVLSLSSSVFSRYLGHTNSDFCILVLSRNLEKLAKTFVFGRLSGKMIFVLEIPLDSYMFLDHNFLSSLYFAGNISYCSYPNRVFRILKLKRKERSTTLQL